MLRLEKKLNGIFTAAGGEAVYKRGLSVWLYKKFFIRNYIWISKNLKKFSVLTEIDKIG